ncbi:MAG: ATP-binding cassette domain-containing protein [Sandarakinorhabdus sp.]|nr:ATP-binding cassette domain-containing protein [Sandarakinorhabdus sp.]
MSGLDVRLACVAPVSIDIALQVGRSEILALVGRSGAGKSSVLKAIAGLPPIGGAGSLAGHVRVDGESWFDSAAGTGLPPHRRRLGLVFQSYALFPHLSASANVMAAMDAPDPGAAQALLEKVHLDGLGERRPHQLSGGQQQRVALARALARGPRLLLLDEPFSAVDRPTRRALVETIQELRADLAIPVVIVSHDIEDVARIADRIAVIEAGRLIQTGPTRDVMASPINDLVRDLVG